MTPTATTTKDTATGPEPDSLIGKVVRDLDRDRLAKVTDKAGGKYWLRSLEGGRAWETDLDQLEVVIPPQCPVIDRYKALRSKAHREGRTAAARAFTAALSRHLRVMHP